MKSVKPKENTEISKFLAIPTIQDIGGSVEHVRKIKMSQKYMKGKLQGP